MDILFATNNKGKLKEAREILKGMNVLSLKDVNISADAEETGETYMENAYIKAFCAMKKSGLITLADDSGLETDFLNGAPGVKSARFLGEDTPYAEKIQIILDMMKDVPDSKRGARFVCVVCAAFPQGGSVSTYGMLSGSIAREAAGGGGFGYDPVFYLNEYKKTLAEIGEAEKNKISHRANALNLMKKILL